MYMPPSVCVCYMCGIACGIQKRVSDSLKLELQAVVNHPMWVLGLELGSSG